MSNAPWLFAAFPEWIARRLHDPLPGQAGQKRFAPQLAYGRHFGPASCNVRDAAVMILLARDRSEWRIPLTLRPTHMPAHAGQVSFPGGQREPQETFESAALREFEEELGVDRAVITVLGQLTPIFVFASNFRVTPVLGMADQLPDFVPSPLEVAAVLTPSITELADPIGRTRRDVRRRGVTLNVPGIESGGHFIWGATAMILGELLSILDAPEIAPKSHIP